ncbi:MAG: hypothetical protein B6D53_01880 [Candidatus Omnitrophica bacterium 4484_49]|nr:MAG: hypothetical protein B6D53_01880 [Candidatus Omnitrophica bacterium 4484_49]HDM08728.1 hypothetical protein [Candidatus Omnitrophota bacterium]
MKDKFLKFTFALTLILILTSIGSNILPQLKQRPEKGKEQFISDAEKLKLIKKMIEEGKLSDKEAMFYKQLE